MKENIFIKGLLVVVKFIVLLIGVIFLVGFFEEAFLPGASSSLDSTMIFLAFVTTTVLSVFYKPFRKAISGEESYVKLVEKLLLGFAAFFIIDFITIYLLGRFVSNIDLLGQIGTGIALIISGVLYYFVRVRLQKEELKNGNN